MQEPTLFTKIINGEIPCHKIYEDDRVIAFLTISPFAEGHTLVVPKEQIDQIWDLKSDTYTNLWLIAQKIALHLRDVLHTDRVGVVVKGFEIAHTHIHLIPVSRGTSVNFDPHPEPKPPSDDELAAIAARIRL